MSLIKLETIINAPRAVVFDLSRSVDVHLKSASQTNEVAIAGRTSGLLELDEVVTWQAVHFGIKQKLTVQITEMEKPTYFVDEMLKGAFKSMRHEHHFESLSENQTKMTDEFFFESPLGLLGKIFNALVLKAYMKRFLQNRNSVLKEIAEHNHHHPTV